MTLVGSWYKEKFFMNTALYPRKESNYKRVDSVGTGPVLQGFCNLIILNIGLGRDQIIFK